MRKRKVSVWQILKPISDVLLALLAFLIAYWLRYEVQWLRPVEPAYDVPISVYIPSMLGLTGLLEVTYWLEGAYRRAQSRSFFDDLYIVLRSALTAIATMIIIIFLATPSYYSRLIFGYAGIGIIILTGASRAIERALIIRRHKRGKDVARVLIVGAGEVGHSIIRSMVARPELGYQIIGLVDDDPQRSSTDIGPYPALGTTADLPEIIDSRDIDQVIITLPWMSQSKIYRIVKICEDAGIVARIVPNIFQMTLRKVIVDHLDGIPLLSVREPRLQSWQILLKRAVDIVVSVVALLILWPVILISALAIKLDSKGPVIFRQTRVGRAGVPFVCYKLRSMKANAEQELAQLRGQDDVKGITFKMHDDPRRTRVGRALRRVSIDELPQFWNVLKGEMSLVGPRPAVPDEVADYDAWHRRRLEIRPGITGLWQVSGRSDLTFDEMVLLDVYYIENWSLFLDLRIMLRTIPCVVLGEGAY